MEKILSEREEEIKQLRNLTNDEIFVLEEKVKDLDRRISEFQDNRSTKLEELLNQESTLQIKKKDLIEDLKQKVEESKVLEIKLIQNKAAERFNKLDRYTS
jgi:transcription initiation factor TFIID subunit TAF12